MYNNNKLRLHHPHTSANVFFWIGCQKWIEYRVYWWVIFLLVAAAAAATVDISIAASWKRLANQQSVYVYKMRNVSFMVYKCCDCGFDLSTTRP